MKQWVHYKQMKRVRKSPHSWKKPRKMKDNTWSGQGDLIRENELFKQYYKLQNILPEDEYDLFLEYLVREDAIV